MYNKCRRYTTETALGDIFKYAIVRSHSQNDTAFQSLDFVATSKLGRVEEVPIPWWTGTAASIIKSTFGGMGPWLKWNYI